LTVAEIKVLARMLWRNRTSCAAAVFMLGAAVAAATITFAVADAALWHDLPYRDPGNLAVLWTKSAGGQDNVSVMDFVSLRANGTGINIAAAAAFRSDYALSGFGDPRQLRGRVLSADYFQTLGVPLVAGRDFTQDEERPGAGTVAIITDHLWQQLFNRQGGLGTVLALNGRAYGIVGILPPYRDPQGEVDIYVPHQFAPTLPRRLRLLTPVVRFGQGSSIEQYRSEVRRLTEAPDDPDAAGHTVEVTSLSERLANSSRSSVSLLFGAGIGLLAIALLNFSTLMAARARQRRPEFSIRIALGASRGKIVGLAVLEAIVLTVAGAAMAAVISNTFLPVLRGQYANNVVNNIDLGVRVLAFMLLTAGTAILTSALAASTTIKGQLSTRHVVLSRLKSGRTVLMAQIGISLALVVSSTVLVGSFFKLRHVNPGFRTRGLYTSRIALPLGLYSDPAKRIAFWPALIANLRERDVRAAITTQLPLSGQENPTNFTIRLNDGVMVTTRMRAVSPEYFDLMRIPLLQGRAFSVTDGPSAPLVVVVNERLAAYLSRFGGPVGQTVSSDVTGTPTTLQVVGVVRDFLHERLSSQPTPEAYYTFAQAPNLLSYSLVLEGPGTARDVSVLLRSSLNLIDQRQPFTPLVPMSDYVDRSLGESRLQAQVLVFFASVAVIVSLSGVYSMVTFLVAGTRRESAIRLALGATVADLRSAVLRGTATYALSGVALGLGILLLLGSMVRPFLFGVTLWNPLLVLACATALTVVCILAAAIPARRIGRVSAAEALFE